MGGSIPGPALTDPTIIDQPVDVVLLAVKDTHNEQADAWLARLRHASKWRARTARSWAPICDVLVPLLAAASDGPG